MFSNWSLAVGFPSNVGTGVLDGPPPFNQESLSGQGYLRTVEDAGPYGFIFTLTYKPKFEERSPSFMSPDYTPILTPEDAKAFIQAVNSLHDGEMTDIRYRFNGITKLPEGGHMYEPDETELRITVLVTSIWDSVVELVFESLDDWQLGSCSRSNIGTDIYGILVDFDVGIFITEVYLFLILVSIHITLSF